MQGNGQKLFRSQLNAYMGSVEELHGEPSANTRYDVQMLFNST